MNKEWKQEIKIGKENNQKFVQIPFNILIDLITYKGKDEGIDVITTEESYTSKCSFFDNEVPCKHESYKGQRVKRGLFKTSYGKTINSDVNGALKEFRLETGIYFKLLNECAYKCCKFVSIHLYNKAIINRILGIKWPESLLL